ncbi:MAG: hypothetical protein FWE16_00400 [Firmicutes bacterium]|nr:hypothetical protein [Bacillota bacterium]
MKKVVLTLLVIVLIVPTAFIMTGCRSNQVTNVRLDGDTLYWDSTARPGAGFNIERRVYRDDVLVTTDTIDIWSQRSIDVNDFKFIEGDWFLRVRRIRSAFPHGANVYREWSSTYVRITPPIPDSLFAPFIEIDEHRLHWLSVPSADFYEIRRSVQRHNDRNPVTHSFFFDAPKTEITMAEILTTWSQNIQSQYFTVRAIKGVGENHQASEWSNQIWVMS